MQVAFSIVGQPRVTITMFNSKQESDVIDQNPNMSDAQKTKAHRSLAERRLTLQGAEQTHFFPVGVVK